MYQVISVIVDPPPTNTKMYGIDKFVDGQSAILWSWAIIPNFILIIQIPQKHINLGGLALWRLAHKRTTVVRDTKLSCPCILVHHEWLCWSWIVWLEMWVATQSPFRVRDLQTLLFPSPHILRKPKPFFPSLNLPVFPRLQVSKNRLPDYRSSPSIWKRLNGQPNEVFRQIPKKVCFCPQSISLVSSFQNFRTSPPRFLVPFTILGQIDRAERGVMTNLRMFLIPIFFPHNLPNSWIWHDQTP